MGDSVDAIAFRLATEGDMRKGLKGPFLQNYVDSVRNIQGWNDGDPLFVNYIGHQMEGAELRTHNHAKRLLLRSVFNPTRGLSNMLQGKVPWHRVTRPGVWEF